MREFVCFITPYLGNVLLFCLVRQILPGKVSAWKMPLYLLPLVLTHVPKWYLGSDSVFVQTFSWILLVVTYTVYPLLFYRGAKWKRIAVCVFFFWLCRRLRT